ncbi:hypothetical protein CW304_14895 [Bacillus sp. UFRGS-B20]|nr:hypothetical protein CW304_14895 [Bacillus sp. UFRGS-B20]
MRDKTSGRFRRVARYNWNPFLKYSLGIKKWFWQLATTFGSYIESIQSKISLLLINKAKYPLDNYFVESSQQQYFYSINEYGLSKRIDVC